MNVDLVEKNSNEVEEIYFSGLCLSVMSILKVSQHQGKTFSSQKFELMCNSFLKNISVFTQIVFSNSELGENFPTLFFHFFKNRKKNLIKKLE